MDSDDFHRLIADLYDAAVTPDGWAGLGDKIAGLFEAQGCGIWLMRGARFDSLITTNLPDRHWTDYAAHYGRLDPWAGLATRQLGVPLVGQQLVSDHIVRHSEFYQDFAVHYGIFNVLGSRFALHDETTGIISLQRPLGRKPFDPDDLRRISLLLGHLQRALQLNHRCAAPDPNALLGLAALEALPCGVVILAADGRILFANAIAEQMGRQRSGLALGQKGLILENPRAGLTLQNLLRNVAVGGEALWR